MSTAHGDDGQNEQEAFSALWDLGKTDPEACRREIRLRAQRLREQGSSLSIQLVGLHGLTILSALKAEGNLIELLPRMSAGDKALLANYCEEGLAFILEHWQVRATNPDFWAVEILEKQLGHFAVLLTELRPGRAEQMLGGRIADLPPDIVDMLDVEIADEMEWVHRIVGRHASLSPAEGAVERLQATFAPISRAADAVTRGGLSAPEVGELIAGLDAALKAIDGALALEPQGAYYGLHFAAFRAFAHLYKGTLMGQVNRAEDGLSLIQAAVNTSPRSFFARSALFEALARLGRTEEAGAQMIQLQKVAISDEQRKELEILKSQASGKSSPKGCWGR